MESSIDPKINILSTTQPSKDKVFSEKQLLSIAGAKVPKHIAIIPDGNRRWAAQQSASTAEGHQYGADIIISIVKAAKEIGVKAITFYTFSTENWMRPQEEVDAVMWLIESYLIEQRSTMVEEGIRLSTIGDISPISASVKETIIRTQEITADCKEIDLILAINYGGRNELLRAFKRILQDFEYGKLNADAISEETISHYLDTARWGDPELLIRTSGEMRISNFLIWQISYTELYVVDTYWPDFTSQHLLDAVVSYQQRERRLGN